VNGILTAMPVLIYNDAENMGIRLYTIPLEDAFYGMLNVLQVVTVYEWLKNKKA
jgi:lycopene cyclase domain-containing protein